MCIESIKSIMFKWETETSNYENKLRKMDIHIKHEITKLTEYNKEAENKIKSDLKNKSSHLEKILKKSNRCINYLDSTIKTIKEDIIHIEKLSKLCLESIDELINTNESVTIRGKLHKKKSEVEDFKYILEASEYKIKSISRDIKDIESYVDNIKLQYMH